MTEDRLHDLGENTRKHKLLTQVVHSIAYSYRVVADFGGKKEMD